ncbi:hypothetical protein ACQFX9_24130 [Aliinostoc sp. HNIBRCY26]|uniref:hypothetical protein n=1 Tax=Aliinostoc sp. HNIBRCY26 TaxID=3418997 RepID=UPI003CFCAC72
MTMKNNHYPPAYLRYLKARLMNLGRPSFWGTAIFLSVVGLIIHEYWANPDIFGARNDAALNSSDPLGASLSREDRAIAADIDNLPLLFGNNPPPVLPTQTVTNPQENKNSNSLLDALKQKSAPQTPNPVPNNLNAIAPPQNQNLFVSETETLLRFGATDNNHLLGLKSLDFSTNPADSTSNSAVTAAKTINKNNQNTNSTNNLSTNINSINNQNTSGLNGTNPSNTNSLNGNDDNRLVQNSPNLIYPNQTLSPNSIINSQVNYTRLPGYNNFNNQQNLSPSTRVNSPNNYLQPNTNNPPSGVYNIPNSQYPPSSTGLNTRPGYVQPTTTNSQPSFSSNFNNNQVVQNQVPQTTQVITGTSPIIGPYTIRNSRQNFNVKVEPLVPHNYGNSIWQQPNQVPQPDLPYTPYTNQFQGQYRNR